MPGHKQDCVILGKGKLEGVLEVGSLGKETLKEQKDGKPTSWQPLCDWTARPNCSFCPSVPVLQGQNTTARTGFWDGEEGRKGAGLLLMASIISLLSRQAQPAQKWPVDQEKGCQKKQPSGHTEFLQILSKSVISLRTIPCLRKAFTLHLLLRLPLGTGMEV